MRVGRESVLKGPANPFDNSRQIVKAAKINGSWGDPGRALIVPSVREVEKKGLIRARAFRDIAKCRDVVLAIAKKQELEVIFCPPRQSRNDARNR
jgi:hypothetical protein